MKKVLKNIGGEKNLAPGMKESLKKCIPDSKVVMGRAKRGLFAGRHIQFGNRVSEDGGNKSVLLILSLPRFMFCSNLAHFLFLILIIYEKN